jgi:hypothetical protein
MKNPWLLFFLGILSCLCVSSHRVFADATQPKIYFLDSIDESTLRGAFYLHWGYLQHYIPGLESQFQDHYKNSAYDLVVVHAANRVDLFNALHDPAAVGLFWVSHAEPIPANSATGIEMPSKLLDAYGSDVLNLFKNPSPSLRWISVVSCDSNSVLSAIHPGAEVHGFDNVTDARQGLSQALMDSDAVLKSAGEVLPAVVNSDHTGEKSVEITRTFSLTSDLSADYVFPPVTLEFAGEDVAGFQQVSASQVKAVGGVAAESQTVWLTLPAALPNPEAGDFLIQSGLVSSDVVDGFTMGDFSVSGSWAGALWSYLQDPLTKLPLGITTNQLRYKGSVLISKTKKRGKI